MTAAPRPSAAPAAGRHIVWDWNGTLLDDVRAALCAVNRMLAARTLPPLTLARYREIFGFPVRDFYVKAGFTLEREQWDALAAEYHAAYLAASPAARLAPGARSCLAAFRARGIPQTVLSASEQGILERQINARGIADFFDRLCGADNLDGASKLGLAARLLESLPAPRSAILMIGDSLHDAEVAAALGVRCLLVARGHQSGRRLRAAGLPVLNSLAGIDPLAGLPDA